jgi:DNA modification methylase
MINFHLGSCLDVMQGMPESSIDSIVTDPPYAIAFMGEKWDSFARPADFQEFSRLWAIEALRVLKPGGHLIAFASPRTYHRMACGVEDAGFEVRDQIMWVTGQGFPKSLNVSKRIDKGPVSQINIDAFRAALQEARKCKGMRRSEVSLAVCGTESGACWNWESGLRVPTKEHWVGLVSLLDLPSDLALLREEAEREIIGRVRVGVKNGAAGGSHTSGFTASEVDITLPATDAAKQWDGWGTSLKPAHEPMILARKPFDGTVAQNVLAYGTGAINIDGCRIELDGDYKSKSNGRPSMTGLDDNYDPSTANQADTVGRWPSNFIHDGSDEVLAAFPESKVKPGKHKPYTSPNNREGEASADRRYTEKGATNFAVLPGQRRYDTGSVSRFFYCAKPSKKERGEGNDHPTIKPIALARYLTRLVTPPGGITLDPFGGSGSIPIGATMEGFQAIYIDNDPHSLEIAQNREKAASQP